MEVLLLLLQLLLPSLVKTSLSVVTKLLSFVSALNSQKHMKPNNVKNRLVTYPEFFFSIYISLCEICILQKKENKFMVFFQNFGLR